MENYTPASSHQQYRGSFQELADARRVLKMMNGLNGLPALPAEDRLEVQRIRSLAIRCIEAATAELIETLDIALGESDLEDATGAEDAFEDHNDRFGYDGPGCVTADPNSAVDDRPCDEFAEDGI